MTIGTGTGRTGIPAVGDARVTAAEDVMTVTWMTVAVNAAATGAATGETVDARGAADTENPPLTTVADPTTDSGRVLPPERAGSAITILRVPASHLHPLVARVMIMVDRTSSGRAAAPRVLAEIRMVSKRPWAPRVSNT